jgi:hypothetical protein
MPGNEEPVQVPSSVTYSIISNIFLNNDDYSVAPVCHFCCVAREDDLHEVL